MRKSAREEHAALGNYGKARRREKVRDEGVEAKEGLAGGRDGSESTAKTRWPFKAVIRNHGPLSINLTWAYGSGSE